MFKNKIKLNNHGFDVDILFIAIHINSIYENDHVLLHHILIVFNCIVSHSVAMHQICLTVY